MGTLTYDCPRLDTHCPHKLATSCRLTSTHNCCACADERVHSRTYRVYIDGIGFVQRGTRWQGYCWFCKEFWTNRLAATDPPLEISQTRIPEIPDQTEFLERWFEFHQGYRVAKMPDGSEQRIAVIGEPFKEVSPGFLPRTLDQLRAGVVNDARRPENILRRERLEEESTRNDAPQESLESALDSLLQEATEEQEQVSGTAEVAPAPPIPTPTVAEAPRPRPMNRGEALLQRNRERFARLFGTREDIQREDYESPLSTMYNRAYDRYRQAEERRATGTTEAPSLEGLSTRERREIEEQLLWGVMRESANTNRDLEREGDVWSYTPRRRQAPETPPVPERQPSPEPTFASWLQAQAEPDSPTSHAVNAAAVREQAIRSMQALSMRQRRTDNPQYHTSNSSAQRNGMAQVSSSIQQITSELQHLRLASEALSSARYSMTSSRFMPEEPSHTLDSQPERPEPLTDEEMTKNLSCQVCYQQLANIAVLPCGHMVMCQWCADVVVPIKHSHIPVRQSNCPMCRKVIKQRFKIHM